LVTTTSSYRVERHFSDNPEDIPEHQVVVVDEYQDFNYLETCLIDTLSGASPVVIAGDDDQALYGFKGSSAEFIRRLAKADDIEHFDLPYCSRCTEVVVEAVKQIVQEAQRHGNLADRIDRGYLCYLPEKGVDSENHPELIHAHCTVEMNKAPYIRRYVAEQIAEIGDEDIADSHDKGHPTALVIGPVHWVGPVYEHLAEHFANVRYLRSEKGEMTRLDAYRRLALNFDSRLGWRILLHLDPCEGAEEIVRKAHEESAELSELLPDEYKERHRAPAELVEKLLDDQDLSDEEAAELEAAVELSIGEILESLGIDAEEEGDVGVEGYDEEPDEDESAPSIVCTSLVGAKGLSAEHVFIVGFVNEEFPKDPSAPSDDEVCQLIVGLSRTRKACHLISCGRWAGIPKKESEFLEWLGDIAVEDRYINKDYWSD
jgi:superfamily I DNA/RNA helicase